MNIINDWNQLGKYLRNKWDSIFEKIIENKVVINNKITNRKAVLFNGYLIIIKKLKMNKILSIEKFNPPKGILYTANGSETNNIKKKFL